jgi:flagellar hook-length control protein FliK
LIDLLTITASVEFKQTELRAPSVDSESVRLLTQNSEFANTLDAAAVKKPSPDLLSMTNRSNRLEQPTIEDTSAMSLEKEISATDGLQSQGQAQVQVRESADLELSLSGNMLPSSYGELPLFEPDPQDEASSTSEDLKGAIFSAASIKFEVDRVDTADTPTDAYSRLRPLDTQHVGDVRVPLQSSVPQTSLPDTSSEVIWNEFVAVSPAAVSRNPLMPPTATMKGSGDGAAASTISAPTRIQTESVLLKPALPGITQQPVLNSTDGKVATAVQPAITSAAYQPALEWASQLVVESRSAADNKPAAGSVLLRMTDTAAKTVPATDVPPPASKSTQVLPEVRTPGANTLVTNGPEVQIPLVPQQITKGNRSRLATSYLSSTAAVGPATEMAADTAKALAPDNRAALQAALAPMPVLPPRNESAKLEQPVNSKLPVVEQDSINPLLSRLETTTPDIQRSLSQPSTAASTNMHGDQSRELGLAANEQILKAISRQALARGRFTLQLNPRELGTVNIEFSTERGELQVTMITREGTTRDLLDANLVRLRQNLADAGVVLGDLDVRQEHRGESAAGDTHTPGQHSAPNSQPGQESATVDAPSHQPTPVGLFDIYV